MRSQMAKRGTQAPIIGTISVLPTAKVTRAGITVSKDEDIETDFSGKDCQLIKPEPGFYWMDWRDFNSEQVRYAGNDSSNLRDMSSSGASQAVPRRVAKEIGFALASAITPVMRDMVDRQEALVEDISLRHESLVREITQRQDVWMKDITAHQEQLLGAITEQQTEIRSLKEHQSQQDKVVQSLMDTQMTHGEDMSRFLQRIQVLESKCLMKSNGGNRQEQKSPRQQQRCETHTDLNGRRRRRRRRLRARRLSSDIEETDPAEDDNQMANNDRPQGRQCFRARKLSSDIEEIDPLEERQPVRQRGGRYRFRERKLSSDVEEIDPPAQKQVKQKMACEHCGKKLMKGSIKVHVSKPYCPVLRKQQQQEKTHCRNIIPATIATSR